MIPCYTLYNNGIMCSKLINFILQIYYFWRHFMDYMQILVTPWFKSILAFIIIMLIRTGFKKILFPLLKKMTKKTITSSDDVFVEALNAPIHFLLLILAFYFAIQFSPYPNIAEHRFVQHLLNTAIIFTVFWPLVIVLGNSHTLLKLFLDFFQAKVEESLINIFSVFLRIILASFGLIMIISEWGYDISALIAGLSIGGLAISFAAKDAISNVIGSIVIILDKPFLQGDYVEINGTEGTVEKISFRSTAIRTYPQVLVSIPNSTIATSPISNYSRREFRRLRFNFGLTYSTTPAQLVAFKTTLLDYLKSNEKVTDKDLSVTFDAFNSSSLDLNITFYTNVKDYFEFLAFKDTVNLKIMEICSEVGVSAAFPSSSIYFENPLNVEKTPDKTSQVMFEAKAAQDFSNKQ